MFGGLPSEFNRPEFHFYIFSNWVVEEEKYVFQPGNQTLYIQQREMIFKQFEGSKSLAELEASCSYTQTEIKR